MDITKIGPKIRKLRIERGITQRQLGEFLNYSESSISYIEKGARRFDEKDLPTLSTVLNVPMTYFIDSTIVAHFRADAKSEKHKNINYDGIMDDFLKFAKDQINNKKN